MPDMLLEISLAVLSFFLLVRITTRWVRETRVVLAGRRQQAIMNHLDWTRPQAQLRRRTTRAPAAQTTPWMRRG